MQRRSLKVLLGVLAIAALLLTACTRQTGGGDVAGLSTDVNALIKDRGLSPQDVAAALKTYVPSGKMDDYLMFSSDGHGGQVLVIGLPSMRLLKSIAVFAPEPWQGYGYSDDTREVLKAGAYKNNEILWGDTHHPSLSETNGDYDGEFLFINDKANARIAVVDLKDFATKQIVKNPIFLNDHGVHATPNTDWIVEGSQYGQPLGNGYAPIEQYKEKYRGMLTMWKFDRSKGRINQAESFAIELPPYWQDLIGMGRGASEGWLFQGSFNTEMATGGVESGQPPFEAGVSQKDMDFLHAINWKKAAEVIKDPANSRVIEGMKVIPMDVAAREGILYLIPEPKSPHGADVSPTGEFIVVAGKLDPHVTIYSFDKIQKAIAAGKLTKDSYGVPVLDFKDAMEAQVELGLGPLHTQFDDKGYAYTSLFLDSKVARWTLNKPASGEQPWQLIQKIPVHYNVGHIAVAGGDTAHPDGKYLVSLNKWSIDRFQKIGPLLPQNLQLIDITRPGAEGMQLLYDMPLGIGEPHYAQIVKADKVKSWQTYPQVGWNAGTQAPDPKAVKKGEERVVRNGKNVEIFMTAVRSHYTPEHITVKKGDRVTWHVTNIESARDATHGFALPGYNFTLSLEPGKTETMTFDVTQEGTFAYYCTEFCSALHLEMAGYFLVEP